MCRRRDLNSEGRTHYIKNSNNRVTCDHGGHDVEILW